MKTIFMIPRLWELLKLEDDGGYVEDIFFCKFNKNMLIVIFAYQIKYSKKGLQEYTILESIIKELFSFSLSFFHFIEKYR